MNNVAIQLNKANAVLCKFKKICRHQKFKIMPFLNYIYVRFQCKSDDMLKDYIFYRKKSLRLMFFQNRNDHTGPLFKN